LLSRLACGLAALLLLAGCDRFFYARLSPESTAERPVFEFGSLSDSTGEGWVWRLEVSGRPRKDTLAQWHTFWHAHLDSGHRYSVVQKAVYGERPAQFSDRVAPESLPAEHIYWLFPGYHGVGEQVYFEIARDSLGGKTIRELTEDEWQLAIRGG
jgi:hypothetical protein